MSDVGFGINIFESASEWIVVCESPCGRAVSHIPPPFTPEDLATSLNEMRLSLLRSSSKVALRAGTAPEATARTLGRRLGDVLLSGEQGIIFDRCRQLARTRDSKVRITVDAVGPSVSQLPWELAVDPRSGDDFLALRLSMVRSAHISEPAQPLDIKLPLRVLGIFSAPRDLPDLDIERERGQIVAAFENLSTELVRVTWLPGDKWQDIARALEDGSWHVLHFVGHGGIDDELESGYLELSDVDGRAMPVLASDIGHAISRSPKLRLVVLNACESAASGQHGLFSSTAAKILREGIPAVVAMQYEITDPAALAFSACFYSAIAGGTAVDQAVTQAREVIKVELSSLEWVTPVLYLASDETQVFRPPSGQVTDTGEISKGAVRRILENGGSHGGSRPATGTSPPRPPVPQPPTAPRSAMRLIGASPPFGETSVAAAGPRGLVAVASDEGQIQVWSTAAARVVSSCALASRSDVRHVVWSPWPRHLATAHADSSVVIWDLEIEVPARVIGAQWDRVDALAFSGNGKWIGVVSGRTLSVFDAQGSLVRSFNLTVGPSTQQPGWKDRRGRSSVAVFAPGDRQIAVGTSDGVVRQYNVRGTILREWRHPHPVTAVAMSRDRLFVGTVAGRVQPWTHAVRPQRRYNLGDHVRRLSLNDDGSRLIAAVSNRAHVIDLTTEESWWVERPVDVLDAGFAGRDVVITTSDGVVGRWEPEREGGSHVAD
jgi:hypothetical protein